MSNDNVGLRRALVTLTLGALVACSAAPTAQPKTPSHTSQSTSPSVPEDSGEINDESAPIKAKPTNPSAGPPDQSARARRIARLLTVVEVTEKPPYHPGYDRSCTGDGACQFGEEWTDRHPGKFGRNGCTTREDVLLEQMRDIEMRWGSECRIYEASLSDPYTGELLTWRDDGYWIQIDHIYPLAEAWHAGAWAWPQRKRLRFANDVDLELLAVSGRANQNKGSATLAEWLPPNRSFQCAYVARYLKVAEAYALTITKADASTATSVASRCA
jgi:Protein of unknown function (DUF1524)